ncbi:MAG: response regulator [Actinomycetota bacterium]
MDDDDATVTFMCIAFEAAGNSVATASSVEEALAEAGRCPPDVVLSDLTLGRDGADVSDGFALLRQLRDRPDTAHAGVLAVSGADHPDVLRAAERRGFDGFVTKPVDVTALIQRVQDLELVVAARRSSAGAGAD